MCLSRQGIQLCAIKYPKQQKNPKCLVKISVTTLCLCKAWETPSPKSHMRHYGPAVQIGFNYART